MIQTTSIEAWSDNHGTFYCHLQITEKDRTELSLEDFNDIVIGLEMIRKAIRGENKSRESIPERV